ncbi:MAG: hypothetical protein AMXMBFR84_16060 [Candidatus Hydrogenedentota bacterium]
MHGGHSGSYCDHATGSLEEVLQSALEKGFSVYGTSEHVPRLGERYLYENERNLGWTLDKIIDDFSRYAEDSRALVRQFEDRLHVLRGYEIEVVPEDRYATVMRDYRREHGFDYMVGSVHFMADISIDGPRDQFEDALKHFGGLENLAVRYYECVAQMIQTLEPEVVGHLDLIRKNGHFYGPVDTPAIREAALRTLETVRQSGAILDLNTAGWRKGLDSPYPAPWIVTEANAMGIPFCFGDDSHGPNDVGAGVDDARVYLLNLGVTDITGLARQNGAVQKRVVNLQ